MVNPALPKDAKDAASPAWQLAGRSVRGASHERSGLPNQDALALWPASPGATAACAVAAVADGHGGARHFRSDVGSGIAVEVTVGALRALGAQLEGLPAERALDAARRAAAQLPARIVGEWAAAVRAHLQGAPITEAERKAVNQAEGPAALATVEADPLLAYGATLLAALAAPHCTVLLQLGDGDVLRVCTDGRTTRPVPPDERLAGNFTTSICRSGADADFRCAVQPVDADGPALLLLCTDGYANSFRTDEDFLKLGGDFLALTREHGLKAVDRQLDAILEDASARGSGDDITLAILQCGTAPGRQAGAGGAARQPEAGAPAPHMQQAEEALRLAQQRIRRLRTTVAALAVALCVSVGWTWRDQVRAAWQRSPVIAVQPEPHAPRDGAPLRPGPLEMPVGVPAEPVAGDAPSAAAVQAQARRTERGVEVRIDLSAMPAHRSACSVHAAVWGKDASPLATGTEHLGDAAPAKASVEVKLLLPYPAEKLRARAMQKAGGTFAVQIDCDKLTVARTERLPVTS
jgi:serine/threonine protein phosphatase PrpC